MTLIHSKSLFNYEDNESASAPLRTFLRNSDDSHVSSRSSTSNIQRRMSRRSLYSFRGLSGFHNNDSIKTDVSNSIPSTVQVESRDANDPMSQKFSSENGSNNHVWSKEESFTRELNMGSHQSLHLNSRSSSITSYQRELDDEEKTIRVKNSRKIAKISNYPKEDTDAEPFSIPALKCGPRLDMPRSMHHTPKILAKECVAVTSVQHLDGNPQNESEVHVSIEVELNESRKKKGIPQLRSILAHDILKNRTISRGRSREVRDDRKDIVPQRLFSRSQSSKASNRTPNSKLGTPSFRNFNLSRNKEVTAEPDCTKVHSINPSHMKRLAVKLAGFRRGKSLPRSESTDVTVVENSPRTVIDAPEVLRQNEEIPEINFHEKPTAKFCGIGMCFTELGEFFVCDSFGEEYQYKENESGPIYTQTHI